MNTRNTTLDLFKGIAILAVILYHAGLLSYGYLGVEVFLVIGGYLITKSIMRFYEHGHFNYFDFLCGRLLRLWPLAIIISAVSLFGGYFTMLPDAYKNTCETAVGTCTFTNNYIQYITAGDYWDTANEYKPLMHTWYLGIIFQFYVLYPLVFMLCHRFTKNFVRASRIVLMIVFSCSVLFFILPGIDTAVTFYLLPARLYEFAAGGIVALLGMEQEETRNNHKVMATFLFFVIILLCVNDAYDMAKVRLMLTVALSVLIILYSEKNVEYSPLDGFKFLSVFVPLGVASYSLYLWHQVIFAFYRYAFNNELTIVDYLLIIGISLLFGYFSYQYVEKRIANFTKRSKLRTNSVVSLCALFTGLISIVSIHYYRVKGVVRDIPELDVYVNNPASWEPQQYNASITDNYEKEFPPKNGKKNVLVVGDSFARDWMNVLLESNIGDSVNLVYSKDIAKDLRSKIAQADIVFLANHGKADKYIDYLPAMMKKQFYRIGDKSYGRGIGVVYNHRRDNVYYQQTILYQELQTDEEECLEFQGMYINMMDSIRNADGSICVFTPDKKLISHDGLHLTRAGAKRYAELINVKSLLK